MNYQVLLAIFILICYKQIKLKITMQSASLLISNMLARVFESHRLRKTFTLAMYHENALKFKQSLISSNQLISN